MAHRAQWCCPCPRTVLAPPAAGVAAATAYARHRMLPGLGRAGGSTEAAPPSRRCWLRRDAELGAEEAPDVGLLLDRLGERLALAMPRLRLHPQQHRPLVRRRPGRA